MGATNLGAELKEAQSRPCGLDPCRSTGVNCRPHVEPRTAGGSREHHPPLTIEIDHTLVVRLRPVAGQRDVPVARLVECATVWVILAKGANL